MDFIIIYNIRAWDISNICANTPPDTRRRNNYNENVTGKCVRKIKFGEQYRAR